MVPVEARDLVYGFGALHRFSDELWGFLAERRLERGKLHRIDRYDVMGDVQAEAPVEEQLPYCRRHLLRLHAREGTFKLAPEGARGRRADGGLGEGGGGAAGSGLAAAPPAGRRLAVWLASGAILAATAQGRRCRSSRAAGSAGSGWRPEGEARLFQRMAQQKAPCLDYHELMDWARVMQGFQAPRIFNGGDWGLADLDSREKVVRPGCVPKGRAPAEPWTED